MPVLVLATRHRVQVDDAVQTVPGGTLDRPVEQLEAFLLHLERRHVVFEVAIVDWQPYAVEAEGGKEGGVLVGKEHLEEAIEKAPIAFIAEGSA